MIERRSVELEQRLANEIEAKDAAQAKAFEQTEQLSGVRADHAREIDRLRQDQVAREAGHQLQLVEREATFRNEIARATERLEGVQNHMLRQISEARDAQKHAETDTQSARRRAEHFQNEVVELRMQNALQARSIEEHSRLADSRAAETRTLLEQKDSVNAELAAARGQLQALNGQVAGLQEQALNAQTQLTKALDELAIERQQRGSRTSVKARRA